MFFQKIKESFGKTPRYFQLGWILVVIGSLALRLVGLDGRAWGYDELSAVFRAMSTSHNWHAHLEKGVAVDGHPAGLRVFSQSYFLLVSCGNFIAWPKLCLDMRQLFGRLR